jgi:hypothetical protein
VSHGAALMRPPNEVRLSCGATFSRSQTQFYLRGRAPSASSACQAANVNQTGAG